MRNTQGSIVWSDVLLTAFAPAIWGSTYIVATELLPPDRPFTAALLRTLPAGLLLAMYCRSLPGRGEWGRLIVLSALNIGFFQALLFVAAYRLPGGLAAVVGAIQPLLVMGLAWALDQRRPPRLAVGAAMLGIAGMAALLLSPGSAWDAIGVAAALAGAACMAAGTYLTRRWQPAMPVLALTGWQLLLGGLILLPMAWAFDSPLPALSRHAARGLCLSLDRRCAAGLCAVVPRHRAAVAGGRVLARPAEPLDRGDPRLGALGQAMRGLSLFGLVAVLASILAVQWAMSPRPPTARGFQDAL